MDSTASGGLENKEHLRAVYEAYRKESQIRRHRSGRYRSYAYNCSDNRNVCIRSRYNRMYASCMHCHSRMRDVFRSQAEAYKDPPCNGFCLCSGGHRSSHIYSSDRVRILNCYQIISMMMFPIADARAACPCFVRCSLSASDASATSCAAKKYVPYFFAVFLYSSLS